MSRANKVLINICYEIKFTHNLRMYDTHVVIISCIALKVIELYIWTKCLFPTNRTVRLIL